jgi:hypothetical protein
MDLVTEQFARNERTILSLAAGRAENLGAHVAETRRIAQSRRSDSLRRRLTMLLLPRPGTTPPTGDWQRGAGPATRGWGASIPSSQVLAPPAHELPPAPIPGTPADARQSDADPDRVATTPALP